MKKRAIILTLLLAILGIATYSSYTYFTVKSWDNLIYPGVKIEDTDLSGKSKEEALNLLNEKYSDNVLKKKINIDANGKNYTIDYTSLDARFNVNDSVEQAYMFGKDKGIFKKLSLIKGNAEKAYDLKFTYNTDIVNQLVSDIENDVNTKPVDATITMIKRGVFQVTPEVVGLTLESDKLVKGITENINGKLDSEEINIKAPIKQVSPKYTADELNKINSKVSSFNTNFSTSGYERSTNITLATKSINGMLLLPGEEFSFNGTVGERTADRGYKEAHVIINNELVDGLGGGICQVSSTLYNAMIRAGVDPTERAHHTIASSYVDIGQDATVDWGNIDYKFKNTFEYPMYIEAFTYNKNLYFNIYSNESLTKRTYKVYSDVYETIEPKTEIIEDPNMYENEQEVVKKSYRGFKVVVYREVYENGVFIEKQVVSKDVIAAVDGVIKKGTKKLPKTNTTTSDQKGSTKDEGNQVQENNTDTNTGAN